MEADCWKKDFRNEATPIMKSALSRYKAPGKLYVKKELICFSNNIGIPHSELVPKEFPSGTFEKIAKFAMENTVGYFTHSSFCGPTLYQKWPSPCASPPYSPDFAPCDQEKLPLGEKIWSWYTGMNTALKYFT